MSELRNEFSWSISRDEIFRTCPRQYWFSYYGYWKGWAEDAPERTRKIYILKNLKTRHAWAGEKVHQCIQRSLYNIRKGIKILAPDEIISITLDQMRAEFRSSRAKTYWKNPKTCALFEHEYGLEIPDSEWKEVANHVEACLRNFYASDIFYALKSHPRDEWLEVEEFSFFHFENVKVNVIVDCAIREGKDVLIYDWKTGKGLSENLPIQLACYALYAMEHWEIVPESLHVIEYNLYFNKANWFSVSSTEIESLKGYMRGSIKDMRSLLLDSERNIPMDEDRFTKTSDERVSNRCNFKKICK